MAILGVAIMLGLMIPTYVNNSENPFNSGAVFSSLMSRNGLLNCIAFNVNFNFPMILVKLYHNCSTRYSR